METKRIVDINTYWATIVKDTAQFGQIAVAENPEFNRLAECIFRALEDSFIHSATEYGVKRWESMLQIAPSAGETLEERKARILTYLNLKLPYTWRVLKQLLEGIVGEDKVTLDYVNDEGKLIVHTDRISDEKLQTVRDLIERVVPMNLVVEQYNHHIEVSWRDINKYAECVTVADMKAVNPDYANDLTEDGWWVYPLPKFDDRVNNNRLFYNNKKLKHIDIELPSATIVMDCFASSGLVTAKLKINNVTSEVSFYQCANLEEAEIEAAKVKRITFCNCYKLKRAIFDSTRIEDTRDCFGNIKTNGDGLPMNYPKLRNGKNMFYRGQLKREHAITLLNSLPEWSDGKSYYITVGIHVDHQTNEEVIAAIANAEAKGWNVGVQWNGKATAAVMTLDLEEIYAKVVEHEMGDYTDENGNRCMLDWGHYVTDTTDYKIFSSIYEAEQYYKLTKMEGIEE